MTQPVLAPTATSSAATLTSFLDHRSRDDCTTVDADARWQAVMTRDARLDGRFVFGVATTGIYCRPSCPARRPRHDRVRFFDGWLQAEAAGFRPCRRCEPRVFADAVEKRRVDHDVRRAREIQEGLHPKPFAISGWRVYGRTRPCYEVGGDYFDFVAHTNGTRLLVAVGDVAGKGLGAALLATSLHAVLRTHVGATTPTVTCADLNRYLCEMTSANRFVTLCLLDVDIATGVATHVNAGHPPPLIVGRDGSTVRLHATGVPLGLMGHGDFAERTFVIERGDRLVLFTDGISEAVSATGDELGLDGVQRIAFTHRHDSAETLCTALFDATAGFADGARPSDDQTIVVLDHSTDTPAAVIASRI